MTVTVTDNRDANRYEIRTRGLLAGFAEYRLGADRIALVHTEIDDRFAGRGLASALIGHALDDVRDRALALYPYCPFVRGYLERHPEDQELVPEGQRQRFGLAP